MRIVDLFHRKPFFIWWDQTMRSFAITRLVSSTHLLPLQKVSVLRRRRWWMNIIISLCNEIVFTQYGNVVLIGNDTKWYLKCWWQFHDTSMLCGIFQVGRTSPTSPFFWISWQTYSRLRKKTPQQERLCSWPCRNWASGQLPVLF